MVAIFCHLACPEAVVQTEHVGDRHLGEREVKRCVGQVFRLAVSLPVRTPCPTVDFLDSIPGSTPDSGTLRGSGNG